MSLQGLRCMAFAYAKLDKNVYEENFEFKNHVGDPSINVSINERIPNYPIDNLCMVGLIIMEDPPR